MDSYAKKKAAKNNAAKVVKHHLGYARAIGRNSGMALTFGLPDRSQGTITFTPTPRSKAYRVTSNKQRNVIFFIPRDELDVYNAIDEFRRRLGRNATLLRVRTQQGEYQRHPQRGFDLSRKGTREAQRMLQQKLIRMKQSERGPIMQQQLREQVARRERLMSRPSNPRVFKYTPKQLEERVKAKWTGAFGRSLKNREWL